MNRDSELLRALALIAAEDATLGPPEDLECRVLAKLSVNQRRKRAPARNWVFAAAGLVLVVLALSVRPKAVSNNEPFSPLPYTAPAAPYEQLEVRRQAVPVAALIEAGFEVHIADPGELVSAEVLVGQDGRPLAVRLSPDEENER